MLGHLSQLAQAGAYLTGQLPGAPYLACRDPQGTLHAFHNVRAAFCSSFCKGPIHHSLSDQQQADRCFLAYINHTFKTCCRCAATMLRRLRLAAAVPPASDAHTMAGSMR